MSLLMRLWPLLLCGLSACGGGAGSVPVAPIDLVPPVNVVAADEINLLFMGNSHTIYNDVPGSVAALLRATRPGKVVTAVTAPASQFLEAHWQDATTLGLLRQRPWSAVVLQAQKYSASGTVEYPTVQAENLAREVRRLGAVPMLFPEWPRLGIAETQRIYDVHVSIAQRQPACVAPIGQAWDIAMRSPALVLHDADGNHANSNGSFLAALVIYASLTGLPPADLPSLDGRGVDAATQALLRAAAAEAVRLHAPRALCPTDRLL